MRCFTLISIILFLSVTMGEKCFAQEKMSITKVVIDAGHGGKDPGALGKKSQEKNITLPIVLKLAEQIRAECKGVTVICTRTTDEFIELHERAEIANRSKADLFISIHCNANPKHNFHGAETYIMGLHRTEANLEIAKFENAAILMEPDYSTNYNGFDPNSDESYITFTLFQNAYLEQSTTFASLVQDEMKDRVGMDDRGVRQAGFLVLYKTTMPSVLIETGFLSNLEEEKFLSSQKGQEYISGAICRAFRRFKAKLEGNGKELAALAEKPAPAESTKVNSPPEKKETVPAAGNGEGKKTEVGGQRSDGKDTMKQEEKPKTTAHPGEPVKPKPKPAEPVPHKDPQKQNSNPVKKDSTVVKQNPKENSVNKESVKPIAKPGEAAVHKDTLTQKKDIAKPVKKEIPPAKPEVKPVVKAKEPVKSEESKKARVIFRVQVATSPKELSVQSKKFAGLPEVWKYYHQGLYKYTIGKETSLESIAPFLETAKSKGFSDAFIVAFKGSERITVAEAKEILSEQEK
ncbi:MAG: N-acetylmuramoyl-L-alanine amidase [Bacteroidetes bacterium]|nr:N-acetylmuramoyl-L-alanine amidase [Bacteroidota bacterium]